jgi:hypothetical protein
VGSEFVNSQGFRFGIFTFDPDNQLFPLGPGLPTIRIVPAFPTSDNSTGTTAVALNDVDLATGAPVASDAAGLAGLLTGGAGSSVQLANATPTLPRFLLDPSTPTVNTIPDPDSPSGGTLSAVIDPATGLPVVSSNPGNGGPSTLLGPGQGFLTTNGEVKATLDANGNPILTDGAGNPLPLIPQSDIEEDIRNLFQEQPPPPPPPPPAPPIQRADATQDGGTTQTQDAQPPTPATSNPTPPTADTNPSPPPPPVASNPTPPTADTNPSPPPPPVASNPTPPTADTNPSPPPPPVASNPTPPTADTNPSPPPPIVVASNPAGGGTTG